jgi:nitrite reductase (NO-forming)
MRRWGPILDWEHLQNWLPGVLGASAILAMAVVAAHSPAQTNARPATLPPSQPAASATNGEADMPSRSRLVPPDTSPLAGLLAKIEAPAPLSPAQTSAVATAEVANPGPMSGHAHAQAHPSAPGPSNLDEVQHKSVADAAGLPGDAAAGRQVFKKCQACHSLEPGKVILGPSLAGIVGRKAAADPDFSYSPALKQAALTWDTPALDAYLMDPQKVVPGNRMPFPGLKTGRDRNDVIAFLAAPASPSGPSIAAKNALATANAPSRQAAAPPGTAQLAPQTKPGGDAVYM